MAHPALHLRIASRSHVVIPARLASTRLPRKLLLRETGKPTRSARSAAGSA